MDYYGEDGSGYKAPLTPDERDFLRLIQFSAWRMARLVAEEAPDQAERFVDYVREELRRVRNEKRPAGLVNKKK
jgi:hypothetical protein